MNTRAYHEHGSLRLLSLDSPFLGVRCLESAGGSEQHLDPSSSEWQAAEPEGQTSEPTLSNVLVGIPAFNEEVAIGSVVLAAKRITDNVVVVDDGSSDATGEIARAAGATVIDHGRNRGKGVAIRSLFEHAITQEYDAVVVLDGDGQHLPSEIPAVVEPVLNGECEIAIGSRYVDRDRTETPIYRRLGQRVLDVLTGAVTGKTLSDSQSGFRAFSPYAIKKLRISAEGMGVESQILSDAAEQNLEFKEVPIRVKYDGVDGQTYNPLRHGISVFTFLLQLFRDRHPMLFFTLPGIVLLFLGGGIGLHTLSVYQSDGTIAPSLVLLSGFALLVGVLGIFSGFVLRQMKRMLEALDTGSLGSG